MPDSELFISILIFVTIVLFWTGISSYLGYRSERRQLSKRIKRMNAAALKPEETPHFFSGAKDLVLRIVGSLGRLFKSKMRDDYLSVDRMFLMAGYRARNITVVFSGLKILSALVILGIFFLLRCWSIKNLPVLQFVLFSFVLAAGGFYIPNLWLRFRIASRRQKIIQGLPDALDLMVVCMEAGTGLDAAIYRVGEEMKLGNKPLSDEFRLLSLELRAGKSRSDALRNLARRVDLEDVRSLVGLLIQTDRFGTSVIQALRVHSDSMRLKRYQRAEEMAMKLPIKLLFPLILFIFPSLFVILLGPAVIHIMRTLLPSMPGR